MVTSRLDQNRQNQALAKALEFLETADKLTSEAAAEIHRGAGEFALRTLSRGSAQEARNHFQQARAGILQATNIEPLEREASLIRLALAQIDQGGEKREVDEETRLPWEDAHKEVRQTVQNVTTLEGRAEALRQVTRKLLSTGQGAQAAPLASLFPQESPELLAVVGLEMLRAGQEQTAETLAEQALRLVAPGQQAGEANPAAAAPTPSLIALWLALGKPDKALTAAPPAERAKERDLAVLVGNVAGLAYQGRLDQARQRLGSLAGPEERLPALIALASAAAEHGQAVAAGPDVESALSLVESEWKTRPSAPWQLVRLARAGVKAGLEDRVQATARLIPEATIRGRMQLETLRGRLEATKGAADEASMQIVDSNTPAYPEALEALARHNARHGAAAAMRTTVEAWEEKHRAFGYLGVALGLQDRDQ